MNIKIVDFGIKDLVKKSVVFGGMESTYSFTEIDDKINYIEKNYARREKIELRAIIPYHDELFIMIKNNDNEIKRMEFLGHHEAITL